MNADALAFQLNAGEVVDGEVTERVGDRCHGRENYDEDCGNKSGCSKAALSGGAFKPGKSAMDHAHVQLQVKLIMPSELVFQSFFSNQNLQRVKLRIEP